MATHHEDVRVHVVSKLDFYPVGVGVHVDNVVRVSTLTMSFVCWV